MYKGKCLCGNVSFTVSGELTPPSACHCSQCRRQSGHYWSASHIPTSKLKIEGEENITWFLATQEARRGFCSTCGSFLFWESFKEDHTSVSMGAFETPTNTKIAKHIFVANKGDYYEINDDLPQSD